MDLVFKHLAEGKINGIILGYDVVEIIKEHYFNYEKNKKLEKLHKELKYRCKKCIVCKKCLFFDSFNFYCNKCLQEPIIAVEDQGIIDNEDLTEINIRYLYF